jgi:hypothetical protein
MAVNGDEGKSDLQRKIKEAFDNAKKRGSMKGANPDAIITLLASDITEAVHAYAQKLKVTVTVNAGQTVAGGVTTTPGTGQS